MKVDESDPPPFSVKIDYGATQMKLDFMLGSSLYQHSGGNILPKTKQTNNSVQNKVYHYFYHQDIPLWFTVRKYVLLTQHNGMYKKKLMLFFLSNLIDICRMEC